MSELARHFVTVRRALLPEDTFRLEEDKIPGDAQGKPDLAFVNCSYPEACEDACFLLGACKRPDGRGDVLLTHLREGCDLVAESAMIQALGKLRYRPALSAIAQRILRDDVDQGIRLNAVESLRQVVKISFQNLRIGRFMAGCTKSFARGA
jgi:hypothetical protein